MMEDELARCTTQLQEARMRYLGLWDLELNAEDATERL